MLMINQELLKECINYDTDLGIFTWLKRPLSHFKNQHSCSAWNGRRSGKQAGCADKRGYVFIGIGEKLYTAHRLAFLYMEGVFPECVDHINQIKSDNRWVNLREANYPINSRNMPSRSDNSSGFTGVSWSKVANKWVAQIGVDHKVRYLGCFSEIEDAVKARKYAEDELGFHSNHGQDITEVTEQ